jgi:plasmid stabilization system protein ParE
LKLGRRKALTTSADDYKPSSVWSLITPEAGRVTKKVNFRRIVASPYPYVIFYRADATEIVIHGVRHAARRPL